MDFLKTFIPMLLAVIVVLVGYNLAKLYVLDNIRANKWVVLGIAIAAFIVPNIIWPDKGAGILQYIQTVVFLFFFLWFLDLIGLSGRGKRVPKNEIQKNNVIRAKAKPNRVKSNEIEVIKSNTSKKKKK